MHAFAVSLLLAAAADDLLLEPSLDELRNTPTSVASYRALRLVATPGVVTVVTREEIDKMGARDLMDVLLLVPGFTFAQDVSGVVGIGFRGNWGHEGKVLLLIDGHEMNETLYATLQFGNHYPVQLMERIEIIRGPGSSLYGGYAELAVINVVTRSARSLSGVAVAGEYGQTAAGLGHRNVSLSAGQTFDVPFGGLEVKIDGLLGQGNRGDGVLTDYLGTSYALTDQASLDPSFGNLRLRWGDLSASFMVDSYRTRSRLLYEALLPRAEPNNFLSLFADARYDWRPLDGVTVTPRIRYKRMVPWDTYGSGKDVWDISYYHKAADRLAGSLTAAWDVVPGVSLALGSEATLDHATLLEERGVPKHTGLNVPFSPRRDEVSYGNLATFGDALVETPLFNVAAGARFEWHSQYGPSFVPRVGITKAVDRLHAKILVQGAFKAPAIENIRLNPDIRPERTRAYEVEVGYLITDDIAVSLNAFDTTIFLPIVYFYDSASETEAYVNFPQTGSRGIEAELRVVERWASMTFTWSTYSSEGKNAVPLYAAGNRTDVVRGMPAHKVTALASFELNEHVSVTPSAVWRSERFGFGGDVNRPIEKLPPVLLLDVFAQYRDLFVSGLDVGAGVHNLLGDDDRYVQAYEGLNSPLPGPATELMVRVSYALHP